MTTKQMTHVSHAIYPFTYFFVLTMFVMYIQYFCAVIFHKICILIAGLRINSALSSTSYQVSFQRLLLHDLSKFSRSEFWPYAEHFYGEKKHEEEFNHAWLHHVEHNDHHSEHFIDGYPVVSVDSVIHPMPDEAILEMVADNLAATRSYEGYWPAQRKKDGWEWMSNAFDYFSLHPITKLKFNAFLCALGYARVLPQEFNWRTIETASMPEAEKRRLLQLEELAQLNN